MSIRVINGDCLKVMPSMEANSVDAIVTDPPYSLTDRREKDCASDMFRHAIVEDAKDTQTKRLQSSIPFRISLSRSFSVCIGAINFDHQSDFGKVEINSDGALRGQQHDVLMNEGDAVETKQSLGGEFRLWVRKGSPRCVGACRCLRKDAAGRVRMVVRLTDDTSCKSEAAASVVTGARAELTAVLSLDLRERSGELLPASSAEALDPPFELICPQGVGALTRACGLPAMAEPNQVSEVDSCADDAFSFSLLAHPIVLSWRPITLKGFMSSVWDGTGIETDFRVWKEALRVLKPGGHMVAFGGTRTYHRMVCAVEDAGFEIRDTLAFLHGVGFPKSLSVSKAIDKAAGAEREVIGPGRRHNSARCAVAHGDTERLAGGVPDLTAPATDAARQWEGWGTALKPAMEMICLARKPFPKGYTVAQNVLEFGTGGLNIDGCRVPSDGDMTNARKNKGTGLGYGSGADAERGEWDGNTGRWPANVIHDGSDEVLAAFPQTTSGAMKSEVAGYEGDSNVPFLRGRSGPNNQHGDSGSAARFFHNTREGESRVFYTAKASSFDRNDGTYDLPRITTDDGRAKSIDNPYLRGETKRGNHHATVKSTELMRWLCRLITPPGGLILDPFCGSGSTLKAAEIEGFSAIGIEIDPAYVEIARRRIASDIPLFAETARKGYALTEEAIENDDASETDFGAVSYCVPERVSQFDLFAEIAA